MLLRCLRQSARVGPDIAKDSSPDPLSLKAFRGERSDHDRYLHFCRIRHSLDLDRRRCDRPAAQLGVTRVHVHSFSGSEAPFYGLHVRPEPY